jgi:hypothetical protein
MSDTFDHAGQAYASWEAEIGHSFFGDSIDPIYGLNQRCIAPLKSHTPSRTTIQTNNHDDDYDEDDEHDYFASLKHKSNPTTFGKYTISEMSTEHCKNAIKYILKTNPNKLKEYQPLIKALNNQIKTNSQSKGFAIIDLDTGEITEL